MRYFDHMIDSIFAGQGRAVKKLERLERLSDRIVVLSNEENNNAKT